MLLASPAAAIDGAAAATGQADGLVVVDKLLAKAAGNEEKLFQMLVDKYGPEPEPEEAKAAQEEDDNKVHRELRHFLPLRIGSAQGDGGEKAAAHIYILSHFRARY